MIDKKFNGMDAFCTDGPIVQVAAVEAAGRIFWGVAFTLAIIKTIKVTISDRSKRRKEQRGKE